MTQNNISRRWVLTAGAALASGGMASKAKAFDFLGNNGNSNGGHDFLAPSQRNGNGGVRQQSSGNGCPSRAAAMGQRTAGSRPITQIRYGGNAAVGSIQVSISQATLYHISAPGVATAYPIGAGRDSRSLVGKTLDIGRQAAWPSWTPTKNIARRMGIPQRTVAGGPCNPLGAFALYLYENGRDTIYRIHGTNEPSSVGNPNASSGCIRMYNEDVVRLQQSIPNGTRVGVHAGPVPGIDMARGQRFNP